jgi:hypothetical protein
MMFGNAEGGKCRHFHESVHHVDIQQDAYP